MYKERVCKMVSSSKYTTGKVDSGAHISLASSVSEARMSVLFDTFSELYFIFVLL